MKLNKYRICFLAICAFCLIAIFSLPPFLVLAREEPKGVRFVPQVALPGFEGVVVIGTDPGAMIFRYFSAIYAWAVPAVGIIAVIMIMIAGFQWMLAGGNESKIGAAKERMKNSVVGLILVLGAYNVLYFINPALVVAPGLEIGGVGRVELPPPLSPGEVHKNRVAAIGECCTPRGGECEGTTEKPVFDLFCDTGTKQWGSKAACPQGTCQTYGAEAQCAVYGATCDPRARLPAKPCCDLRLKCVVVAGRAFLTGAFVRNVHQCFPPGTKPQ